MLPDLGMALARSAAFDHQNGREAHAHRCRCGQDAKGGRLLPVADSWRRCNRAAAHGRSADPTVRGAGDAISAVTRGAWQCQTPSVSLTFERVAENETDAVVAFLWGSEWPFHGVPRLSAAEAAAVSISNADTASFWMREDAAAVGLVRLLDLRLATIWATQLAPSEPEA